MQLIDFYEQISLIKQNILIFGITIQLQSFQNHHFQNILLLFDVHSLFN
jgi:hypothetical protein